MVGRFRLVGSAVVATGLAVLVAGCSLIVDVGALAEDDSDRDDVDDSGDIEAEADAHADEGADADAHEGTDDGADGDADADADADAGDGEADGGPACEPGSEPSGTWCDPLTGHLWQNPPDATTRNWDTAVSTCNGLSLGGSDDWSLPSIDELRSLVRGCADSMTEGACGVTEGCLDLGCGSWPPCSGCTGWEGPGSGGCYWDPALGGTCLAYLSSSSVGASSEAWYVAFNNSYVGNAQKTLAHYVRCVRREPCVPDCTSRECGDDGCGSTCGPGCGASETCNADGHCIPTAGGIWVAIEPGTFEMGSPGTEAGRYSWESMHSVTLTRGFAILSTEVTQTEFTARMTYNPSLHTGCADCPVERVDWNDAAAYCNALSVIAGRSLCYDCTGSGSSVTCSPSVTYLTSYDCPGYRLPTEAEWEYGARAGDARATYNGDLDSGHLGCETPNAVLDSIAWFCGNSGSASHAVGTRAANAWGLYDMLGNVSEWCHDLWDRTDYAPGAAIDPWGPSGGSGQAIRGGSWGTGAGFARAAFRCGYDCDPAARLYYLGFRPVRSLP